MKELYNYCTKYERWLGKVENFKKLEQCKETQNCDKCPYKIGQWVDED